MKSHELVRTTLILQNEEFPQEDQRSFQKLYQLHRESLLKILYRFSGDWSQAEDAVHHAFATLFEKRRDYDLAQPLKSLLLTIALNYARIQHRSHARKDSLTGPDHATPTIRDRQSPVEAMIRDLPPEERAIVVLRFYDHASYQEIAQILRIPLGTVKWKMHETIRKLRPRLEALSDEL